MNGVSNNVPTVAEGRDRRTPTASEHSKCNQKINRFQTHENPACGNCVLQDGGISDYGFVNTSLEVEVKLSEVIKIL
jgi:hypothetical protein